MSESFEAMPPREVAARAEDVGVTKVNLGTPTMLLLAVLGGAFIGLGACLASIVGTGIAAAPYGLGRWAVGLAFSLGLTLVVLAGAELFTGNNLAVMAWVSGKVRLGALLRSWGIVYAGNLLGAVLTASLVFLARVHAGAGGAVGDAVVAAAEARLEQTLVQTLARAVLANALVCLAVWMAMGARSTVDKVVALTLPVAAFVAAGFEHCVANMFTLPWAAMISAERGATFDVAAAVLRNLLPVTLGNIVGGAGLVGLVYWRAYRAPRT